ncbi:MAG: 50S ribosomal protein L11 [archaeon]|nr:50S ribosomal protein L11 [archaeon]
MLVKLIVDGGKMAPGPAVSQQLGPMGINLGKVISDVNEATKGFAGMKVPVELDVDPKTKTYKIKVSSPPVAELVKKELGLEKGSGEPKTFKAGNIPFERVVFVAKTKLPNLLAKDLRKAVKLVVGTCVSLGVLIDNKEAKEIENDIDAGVYDSEIKNESTEPSAGAMLKRAEHFAVVKARQEKEKKAREEAKAAEEAAKAAAAAAPGAPGAAAPGAAPAAGAPAAAAPGAAPAKAESKPAAKPAAKK